MIKKTLFISLLLLILYSFLIIKYSPKWEVTQHQWQDNLIKAQSFLYNETDTFKNIIIGSSLSDRLKLDDIAYTYNLSFSGQSIFDGLTVLSLKDKLPEKVFIEMNAVLLDENKDFVSFINSRFFGYIRKNIPSFREDKQPVGVIGSLLRIKITDKVMKRIKTHFKQTPVLNQTLNQDSSFFFEMLKLQENKYLIEPDKELISRQFDKLKKNVDFLTEKGVSVVFFEMPINQKLCDLPLAKTIRNSFYNYFPKNKYYYIPIPDCSEYATADGIHLKSEEIDKYINYFKQKMDSL